MARSLGSIFVDLIARTAKYEDGFKKAKSVTSDFEKGVKSLLGQLAPLLGGAGFAAISKSALDTADEIKSLADKLGLTTDQIQRYEYAAKLSNVSNEQLQTGFAYLNKQIAQGTVPYNNLEDAIQGIAGRMENAKDGTARARLAFEAFGKSGFNLIPFFREGKEGLKSLGDEAQRLGIVLSSQTINQAKEFKDQLDALGIVVTRNFQAGLLEGFVGESQDIRDIYTDQNFIDGVKHLGEAFGLIAKGLIDIVAIGEKASTVLATIGLAIGADVGLVDKDVYLEALKEAKDRLNATPQNLIPKPGGNTSGGGDNGGLLIKDQAQLDLFLKSLQQETDSLGLSQRALAQQKAIIQATAAAHSDWQKKLRDSPELTDSERESVELLSGSFYDLQKAQQEAERYNESAKNAFEDFAQSIFTGSAKAGDAIRNLVKAFAELALKQQLLRPLSDAIFGTSGSGGGGAGGLFSGFGSWLSNLLPSFDVGTDRVSNDMVAQIHKDEAILNPQEADAYRKGRIGRSGDTYIDARGTDQTGLRRLESLIIAKTSQSAIINNWTDAQQRGAV